MARPASARARARDEHETAPDPKPWRDAEEQAITRSEPRFWEDECESGRFCAALVARDRLDLLEWAIANGAPHDLRRIKEAAAGCHLELLTRAVARMALGRTAWDASVFAPAARNGHIEVLRWASEAGARPGVRSALAAIHAGRLEGSNGSKRMSPDTS